MINKLFIKIKRFTLSLSKGFTLIETLVAVAVLMVAIAGPLTIASKGLQATLIAKDQDTAFYLAQDGIEYIRWVRDTNKLEGNADWLAGLDGTANAHTNGGAVGGQCTSTDGSSSCYIDSLQDTTVTCPGNVCPGINYDSTNDYFSYITGTATAFTRTIQLITNVGGNAGEAMASTTVSWSDQAGITRTVQVREDIFNWQ